MQRKFYNIMVYTIGGKMERIKDENGFKFSKGKVQLTITATEVIMHKDISGFLCFKQPEINFSIKISDIMFFDYEFNPLGFRYTITGGNNNHFYMKGLKKSECIEIRQWLIDHGTKLSTKEVEGKTFSHSGIHPFGKETITLMDDVICHHRKTIFTNRDSCIPYDEIDFFLIVKSGIFSCSRKLAVIGSLSFQTVDNFSSSSIESVKEILMEKSIKLENGKVYHPHLFSGVKERKNMSLILFDDKIVYMGPTVNANGNVEKDGKVKMIKNVTFYTCKPIFSLFKRFATIKGTGFTDMRTNEYIEYTIYFPGVFFFWWFCDGKIKTTCKKLK